MFAGTARPGDSPLNGWSAAAAIGMAAGAALGGILTQIFDWRAIFLAQAPVAALTRRDPGRRDADPIPERAREGVGRQSLGA